ncbi:MAG: deoxyguanosinetriphosphate triphosphohydrolase [Candidatus Competibacterales bacterium]|nr:deoxyguanosinetriphosphate triphosphohydrolase [Candidatus Competibacterales bacterium]
MKTTQARSRWSRLLSRVRLGRDEQPRADTARTDFQRDFDRIVFSSAFRRLQDKTQVFPLAQNDYVRTRLTHSLEASSVGRTLGTRVGEVLIRRYALDDVYPQDFGAVVAAACLAHDIGNPPFGHAGEDAIRSWFHESGLGRDVLARLAPAERRDLAAFEGNAQGFRLLTRLQSAANAGGLQLTCATLGAFSKYPCDSGAEATGFRKFGYFQAERELFAQLAARLNLLQVSDGAWRRHPLAYLVEAADDICYRIVDIEDAHRLRQLDYPEARALLLPLAGGAAVADRLEAIATPKERIEFLRAKAIGAMVDEACHCFLAHEPDLLAGDFEGELLDRIPSADALRTLRERAEERVYVARPVVEIGAAGFGVLAALMEGFVAAVDDVAARGTGATPRNRMLSRLIPAQFLAGEGASLYEHVLGVTDFVSGMTDSYAVALYRKLQGISLPTH